MPKLVIAGILFLANAVYSSQAGEQPVSPGISNETAYDSVETLLWQGIDAMYSYRFAEADQKLQQVIAQDSTNVMAPFIAVANSWLRSQTEDGYRASHEVLFSAADAAIPVYEQMLAAGDHRPEVYLYLGSTYGLKARVALAGKRWTSVVYSGLKGLRLIRKAHQADSSLTDAYLPLGVFDYYTGVSSMPVQILARMFGIRPDRQIGIAELDRAVREARYAWIEAASTLSILYLYIEDNPAEAMRYTKKLLVRYPENYYFSFLYGEALVHLGRLAEAREFLPRLRQLTGNSHPNQQLEWTLKLATLEASLALAEGDTATALSRVQWVTENYEMEFDWHLGIAYYIRGMISEAQGQPAGAAADYRAVIRLDNHTHFVNKAAGRLADLRSRL